MSLRTFNIALFGICISVFISLRVTAQVKSAVIPKQLTVFREYKNAYAVDLSDDGQLLLLNTFIKSRDPLGEGYYSVVEFEGGREIDRLNWINGRGKKEFLSDSHKILYQDYVANIKKIEVSIRDTLTKTSHKCLIANDDFKGRSIFFFDSQKAIATFSGSTSLPADKLFLLTLPTAA